MENKVILVLLVHQNKAKFNMVQPDKSRLISRPTLEQDCILKIGSKKHSIAKSFQRVSQINTNSGLPMDRGLKPEFVYEFATVSPKIFLGLLVIFLLNPSRFDLMLHRLAHQQLLEV